MAIYDVNGNRLDQDNISIKPYFAVEMGDTISKIRALQNEPNLTLFYITDIHSYVVSGQETLYKTSVENMRYLLTEIPCDGVVNLGDSINGDEIPATSKGYGNLVSNEFRKIPLPYYSCIGNHDDNRYSGSTDDRFTVPERYQLFVNPTRRVEHDTTGLNFYVDFPEFKIRLIFLNGVSDYTYKFNSDTCTWFSSVALDTPAGWGVFVNSHIAPFSAWNYNSTNPTGGSTIKTAMDTYAATNDVLALFCGHNHVDCKFTSPYPGMTLCCEKFENENGDPAKWPTGAVKPQRTANDYTEDCWTVVIVRPNSRKINLVRFGAGSDYELDY